MIQLLIRKLRACLIDCLVKKTPKGEASGGIMSEIDEVIEEHGGWPDAFATSN